MESYKNFKTSLLLKGTDIAVVAMLTCMCMYHNSLMM